MNLIIELCKYYDYLEKKGKLFLTKDKRAFDYKICLDVDGKIVDILEAEKNGDRNITYEATHPPRTSNIMSFLMDQNIKYALGINYNKKSAKVSTTTKEDGKVYFFDFFKKENDCLNTINDPLAKAICGFMNKWSSFISDNETLIESNLGQALNLNFSQDISSKLLNLINNCHLDGKAKDKKETNYITFVLDGQANRLLANEPIMDALFLDKYNALKQADLNHKCRIYKGKDAVKCTCFVDNTTNVVAPLKHFAIKHIAGADPLGVSLFNNNEKISLACSSEYMTPYKSEFLTVFNISYDNMAKYTKALNWLLDWKNGHSIHIKNTMSIVMWGQKETEFTDKVCKIMTAYNEGEVINIIKKLTNNEVTTTDTNHICVAAFSAITKNMGDRIIVNFFDTLSETEILTNIKKFQNNLQIFPNITPNTSIRSFISALAVSSKQGMDDYNNNALKKIIHDIIMTSLFNVRLPYYIAEMALQQFKKILITSNDSAFICEQNCLYKHTTLLLGYYRAFLIQNNKGKDLKNMLNDNINDNYYLCGRLFAITTKNVYGSVLDKTKDIEKAKRSSRQIFKKYSNLLSTNCSYIGDVINTCASNYDTNLLVGKEFRTIYGRLQLNNKAPSIYGNAYAFYLGYAQQKNDFILKCEKDDDGTDIEGENEEIEEVN